MLTRLRLRALLSVAATALATGCAQVSTGGTQSVSLPSFSSEADAFFSQVESIRSTLSGSPTDRANAELASQENEQRAYAACMRAAGFEYDIPNLVMAPQPSHYEPSWWAKPSLDDAAKGLGYAAPPAPVPSPKPNSYQSLAPADKAAYDVALDGCLTSVGSQPAFSGPPNPAAQKLLRSLEDTLLAASSSSDFAAARAEYASCMEAHGVTVKEPGGLYDAAETELAGTGLFALDPYSSQYAAQLPAGKAIEVRLAEADVECRAPLADTIASQLSPALTKWLEGNGDRIQAVGDGWKGTTLTLG